MLLLADSFKLHFDSYCHNNEPVGTLAEGIELLAEADIAGVSLSGKNISGKLVSDNGIITLQDASDIREFKDAFTKAITHHRFWTREAKEMVPA